MFQSLSSEWAQQVLKLADFGVLLSKADNTHWLNPRLRLILQLGETDGCASSLLDNDLLETLVMQSSPFEITDSKGESTWLKREHIKTADGDVYFFHYCNDLVFVGNECRRLQKELADMTRSDPTYGLINNDVILQLLDGHISRSRRYFNPLSLLRISYQFSDSMEPQLVSRSIQRIAFFLKDQLRWADQIGLLDPHSFLVILPETNYDSALSLLNKFNTEPHLALFSSGDGRPLSFSMGLTEWKKGDVAVSMLKKIQYDVDVSVV